MLPDAHFTRLPPELHRLILAKVSGRDTKNLRLTCSLFRERTPLNIPRVFLSANERNIDVFRAIADHDIYRAGVTEIIWDDALLPAHIEWKDEPHFEDEDTFAQLHGLTDSESCPPWFVRSCEQNLEGLTSRKDGDLDLPQHRERYKQAKAPLPLPVSYAYYRGLVMQQENVLAAETDVAALTYGLARFPALRRMTITPAAHGLLYEPLYETPMIRDFPFGFNYPIPRGWPTRPWTTIAPVNPPPWHPATWRGVSIVLRALAEQKNGVSEFLVDVHGLATGLNCRLFDNPTHQGYQSLAALLHKPDFRRIDLALLVAWDQWLRRPPFRNGHLRNLLAHGEHLEHVRLSTDLTANQQWLDWHFENLREEDELRLRDLYPVEQWPRLRHFGLAGFWVRQSDLVALLAAMPPSLRCLELSNLHFLGDGSHRSLLCDMRDQLDWRERPAGERPKTTITVGNESGLYTVVDRVVCIEDQVSHFLFGDGPNPFGSDPDTSPNSIEWGFGVERDEFDPDFERPWMIDCI